jgi:CRP-like cAMP-binding protein
MADSVADRLKKFDFFAELPDEVIDSLVERVEKVSLKPDDVLFNKGDMGDALYVVERGRVKMVGTDKDGQEVVFNQVGAGALIGEMAIIDQQPRSAGVVALTETELLKLGQEAFMRVMEEQPQLGMEISRNVIQRLRLATTYIELAIEWSKEIADGNYEYVEQQAQAEDASADAASQSDRERAQRFLGTFFQMVKGVREREEQLKKELVQLKVVIDQQRRHEEVADLASSEFFQQLRKSKEQKRGGGGSGEE